MGMSNSSGNSGCIRLYSEDCETLSVQLPPKREWVDWIRKVPGRKWDTNRKLWLFPGRSDSVTVFCYYFKEAPINIMDQELVLKYPELLILKNSYEFQSIKKLRGD